ncbi:MAG: efflux RND transporter permease subunit, partial [Deltaproteobacteria bacterium]
MIGRIIAWCAKNRLATLLLVGLATAWGVLSLRNTALDAVPDLSDVQVIVFSEWMGRAPDLIEDNITYPVVSSMLGSPRVTAVRGQSMFGMSFVNVIFEDGTDMYWARSRVLEKLSTISNKLPQGVTPILGPDATGVGWVFEYALIDKTGHTTLQQLQSLQDWNIRYALQAVPGVAEVASVGGFVKEYQVDLDPDRLAALGIPLSKVVEAVKMSNADVGGRILEVSGTEHYVRGRGYVKNPHDLEKVVLGAHMGTPVLLRNVGAVRIGPAQRRGLADLDGEGEVVGGVVVARSGTNALQVIDAVKARIEELKQTLPKGVQIVPTYDRSTLIRASIETLKHTLIEELIVVTLVILLFLLHFRSTLVPALLLPIAVLLAFIPMKHMGLTANIMSLGGIAIAIGAMVDAAIIVVENVHKKLEAWEASGKREPRAEIVVSALQEVGRPIFFSLLVITVGFLPVFTLEGTEGRLFSPLAWTKTFSMAFAAVLSVTLVPAIATTFIRGHIRPEERNPISRALSGIYDPICRFALRFRWPVIISAFVLIVVTLSDVLQRQDQVLRKFPEVERVFGKAGRFDSPTDPAPLSMFETVVTLKDPKLWPKGEDWDALVRKLDGAMQFAGMPNIWWMPIQTRTEMLATGVRSPLGVLVLGPDTKEIDRIGAQIEAALRDVPGTRSAFSERIGGGYFLDFDVDRDRAARFGLNVGDVEDVVETAVGGLTVSTTVEGRERYPVTVRYARDFRSDLNSLGRVRVATMDGAQISLGQVANLRLRSGPSMLRDENGQLAGYVFADTSRPIDDYVRDAKKAVADKVQIPPGYRLDWAGQYRYLERAKARLGIVVPVTLAIIFMLLFFNSGSAVEALLVMLAVPFSLVGAFWLLWLLNYNMSVAVWVGLIALAGLDAETGIVMLLYLDLAWKEKRPATREEAREAVVAGAVKR